MENSVGLKSGVNKDTNPESDDIYTIISKN